MTAATKAIIRAWVARERSRVTTAAFAYRARLDTAEKWLASDAAEAPDMYTAELFETCLTVERLRLGTEPGFFVDAKRVRTAMPVEQWTADVTALKAAAIDLGAVSHGRLRENYPGLFEVTSVREVSN